MPLGGVACVLHSWRDVRCLGTCELGECLYLKYGKLEACDSFFRGKVCPMRWALGACVWCYACSCV